jgi:hypothetical protein
LPAAALLLRNLFAAFPFARRLLQEVMALATQLPKRHPLPPRSNLQTKYLNKHHPDQRTSTAESFFSRILRAVKNLME